MTVSAFENLELSIQCDALNSEAGCRGENVAVWSCISACQCRTVALLCDTCLELALEAFAWAEHKGIDIWCEKCDESINPLDPFAEIPGRIDD